MANGLDSVEYTEFEDTFKNEEVMDFSKFLKRINREHHSYNLNFRFEHIILF